MQSNLHSRIVMSVQAKLSAWLETGVVAVPLH